ncbi:MAG: hypothetical protein JO336_17690 [Acidobacteriia bacterium]|nr:hypothetical protein [Terriglobia bacterium]MBV8903745.1 hypothetical protein [Terriglobia bacterium]MBV9744008.1 hypothetical protein [Terriglobia bacterium]
MHSPAAAFRRILEVLDRLEIPYFVTGSVASSVYGIPRTTRDIDIVAAVRTDQLEDLASELQGEFYADLEMMKESVRRARAFNVIHRASTYKIDIFPLGRDEYSREAFARRRFAEAQLPGVRIECALASAEDVILSKLRWYRAGGENSEAQWNDLRGIVEINGARLNLDYLRHWAARLSVADLLERLIG